MLPSFSPFAQQFLHDSFEVGAKGLQILYMAVLKLAVQVLQIILHGSFDVPSGRHFCPFCLFGGALWADYLTPDWFRSLFQISTAAILIPTWNLHDPPKIVPHRRPSVLNEKSDIEKK